MKLTALIAIPTVKQRKGECFEDVLGLLIQSTLVISQIVERYQIVEISVAVKLGACLLLN